jgi:threonine/homoserine/homoserine lactone efflux protein
VIRHLEHNWPLTLVALCLAAYLVVVLVGGTFFTNQDRIERATDPARYWRWIRIFVTLLLLSTAVLIGSYVLGPAH